MDQVSFEKLNLKDILKDSLSLKSRSSNVESYKGQFKGHFVL
jgi:hypothetical protein